MFSDLLGHYGESMASGQRKHDGLGTMVVPLASNFTSSISTFLLCILLVTPCFVSNIPHTDLQSLWEGQSIEKKAIFLKIYTYILLCALCTALF
jgi:hypothetical protein